MEDIEVYSSYAGHDELIGTLYSDVLRGIQVYSFEYADNSKDSSLDYRHQNIIF